MEKIDLKEIIEIEKNGKKLKYHFTDKSNLENISEKGLVPNIGKNAVGIDSYSKTFYSEGLENMLTTAEIWLDYELRQTAQFQRNMWKRNKEIGDFKNKEVNHIINLLIYIINDTEISKDNSQFKEIYSKINEIQDKYSPYKLNENKDKNMEYKPEIVNMTLERVINDFKNRRYLILDYDPKMKYFDENKITNKKFDEEKMKNEFFQKNYGGSFTNFESPFSDSWNMYTTEKIDKDKIKQITVDDKEDSYSILKENYRNLNDEKKKIYSNIDNLIKYEEIEKEKQSIEEKEKLNKSVEEYREYRKEEEIKLKNNMDERKKELTIDEKIEKDFFQNIRGFQKEEDFLNTFKNIKKIKIGNEDIKLTEKSLEDLDNLKDSVEKEYKEKKQEEKSKIYEEKIREIFREKVNEYQKEELEIEKEKTHDKEKE